MFAIEIKKSQQVFWNCARYTIMKLSYDAHIHVKYAQF